MSKKIDRLTIGSVTEGTWIRNRTNGIIHVVIDVVEDGVVVDKNFVDVKSSYKDNVHYDFHYKRCTKSLKFATLFKHYVIMENDEIEEFKNMVQNVIDHKSFILKDKFTNEEYEAKSGVERIVLITDDMVKFISFNKLGAYDFLIKKSNLHLIK